MHTIYSESIVTTLHQFQNAYRPRHSTETFLLAILYNIFNSSDSGNSTLLVSLDLSAAFDSTDLAILLSRLKTSFDFGGVVYHWIESYLTHHSQTVTIGNNSSAPRHVASGVPQGSVLGPILFSTSPIAAIASTFSVPQQQFADDSQLYISLSPPISSFKSIVLKIVSLPCTPGAVITPFLSILINLTLFSSEPGNALILSRMSPWSTFFGLGCSNGRPRQATRRHTRQSLVDGQARE